jgi:hypothetical protein
MNKVNDIMNEIVKTRTGELVQRMQQAMEDISFFSEVSIPHF